ncbi:hypothetical protein [Nocardia tengchongensis]|uniref:hypothetical protein n=1 Tax=Nocardia tengchongensis TaxID=2055889 RepID=UPI0036795731
MLYKLIRSLGLVAAVLMAFLTTSGQAGGAVELAEDKSCGLTWQPQPPSDFTFTDFSQLAAISAQDCK